MYAGRFGSLDNFLRFYIGETADILSDGPIEQFNVLRKVTKMWAQIVPILGLQFLTV